MEKSNIIISIIIVICIAAGVTAYGLTSDDNGIFKSLQGIGTNTHGTGTGIGNNTTITNDNNGNGGSEGVSPYGTGDSPYGGSFYYNSANSGGISDSGSQTQQNNPTPSNSNNDNTQPSDSGQLPADYNDVAYIITTDNEDGTYTITYYNRYNDNIGYHTFGPGFDEGGGGAPIGNYTPYTDGS
ncbi:hypothetical protein BGI41_01865 [Methanobrevibacter sp. 87.7]|uniref:hypothetical protein n=1 Tax=Methanobrevibacter sp. 87.7 TaxID=387957 RepID=UPI000B5034D3|nr:hypothetical protein [Methanobrevibacter sp. 87.7]OWT33564.1 hypothetical protein BGI41_01865 [Methanobrevibacter sp. 87.7]